MSKASSLSDLKNLCTGLRAQDVFEGLSLTYPQGASPELLKAKNYILITQTFEEVAELGLGVGLGGGEVFFGETVVEHLAVGFLVEGLVGLWGPFATLVEGLGFGFVDEVFVQEGDLG